MKIIRKISLALAMATISGTVLAAAPPLSATGNFQATATLNGACKIDVNPLSFGTIIPSATPTLVNTTMNLICSKGLTANIGIEGGNNADRTNRYMNGNAGNTDKLIYNVYSTSDTSSKSESWGMTSTALDTYSEGTPQQITIYGQVDSNQYVKPDTYKDTLTVTVNY